MEILSNFFCKFVAGEQFFVKLFRVILIQLLPSEEKQLNAIQQTKIWRIIFVAHKIVKMEQCLLCLFRFSNCSYFNYFKALFAEKHSSNLYPGWGSSWYPCPLKILRDLNQAWLRSFLPRSRCKKIPINNSRSFLPRSGYEKVNNPDLALFALKKL